jgi:hypothetical protein
MEDTAGFALAMLLSALTILLPASAQKAPAPHETYVGILVTHTAEDAERALKDLKAGADFGVLAKERSIEATANDGGCIGRQIESGRIFRRRPSVCRIRGTDRLPQRSQHAGSGCEANPFAHFFGSGAAKPHRRGNG